jgi:hypothetical protein
MPGHRQNQKLEVLDDRIGKQGEKPGDKFLPGRAKLNDFKRLEACDAPVWGNSQERVAS